MASYEFECQNCQKKFTVQQTFAEHDRLPKPKCPACGSADAEQLVGTVHVKTDKKS
jgi:putative FmdB family regulatory protein